MRATMMWRPNGQDEPDSLAVYVTSDELAGLRSALKLPPASIRQASVTLKTRLSQGRVVKQSYALRFIQDIIPDLGKKTPRKAAS